MKTKIINISLPAPVLKEIDRKAKEEFRSRSELLKEASLFYIQSKDNWRILQNDLAVRAQQMGLQSENDVEAMVDSFRR
jgi:metal-responsive CopG/Arc/MetJ family transcriptional regulator